MHSAQKLRAQKQLWIWTILSLHHCQSSIMVSLIPSSRAGTPCGSSLSPLNSCVCHLSISRPLALPRVSSGATSWDWSGSIKIAQSWCVTYWPQRLFTVWGKSWGFCFAHLHQWGTLCTAMFNTICMELREQWSEQWCLDAGIRKPSCLYQCSKLLWKTCCIVRD